VCVTGSPQKSVHLLTCDFVFSSILFSFK